MVRLVLVSALTACTLVDGALRMSSTGGLHSPPSAATKPYGHPHEPPAAERRKPAPEISEQDEQMPPREASTNWSSLQGAHCRRVVALSPHPLGHVQV